MHGFADAEVLSPAEARERHQRAQATLRGPVPAHVKPVMKRVRQAPPRTEPVRSRRTTVVIRVVARHFGVPEEDMAGRASSKALWVARATVMFILRTRFGFTLERAGAYLGRSEAAALQATRRVQQLMVGNPAFIAQVNEIKAGIDAALLD